MKMRLLLGISGASGAPIAVELLHSLKAMPQVESHLIVSDGAAATIACETGLDMDAVRALADVVHDAADLGAAVSSGTFKTAGMIVAPCSMKTLAGIACGYSENLLLRAADVILKERRTLVLLPRETPFSAIHLENMLKLARLGAVILPPMLSYYNNPANVGDMTRHIAAKALDCFGLEHPGFLRWGGR